MERGVSSDTHVDRRMGKFGTVSQAANSQQDSKVRDQPTAPMTYAKLESVEPPDALSNTYGHLRSVILIITMVEIHVLVDRLGS